MQQLFLIVCKTPSHQSRSTFSCLIHCIFCSPIPSTTYPPVKMNQFFSCSGCWHRPTEKTLLPVVMFMVLWVSAETRSSHGHNQPLNHVVCSQVKTWSPLSGLFLNLAEEDCNEFALPGVPYVALQCPWAWQRLLSSSSITSELELKLNFLLSFPHMDQWNLKCVQGGCQGSIKLCGVQCHPLLFTWWPVLQPLDRRAAEHYLVFVLKWIDQKEKCSHPVLHFKTYCRCKMKV